MKDLYLRAAELSNFRIYGDSYAFEFPATAGITLITGANGMGKTSFFDAVEWALTGQVSRFSDIQTDARRKTLDPLTRIGAPADSHRVSLQFTDGSPIDRGAGFIPNEAQLTRLLKHPRWPQVRNLHGYLSITHFLGQASTRRFSLREPQDQWEALKGPAGVDRINSLRQRMSGQGTRQAFTRALKERTQHLEFASEALRNWKALLAEWERAQRLASSEQPVPPNAVNDSLERLAIILLPMGQGFAWKTLAASDEPESSIKRFAELLRTAEDLHQRESARSDRLARLADSFDASRSEGAALTQLIEAVTARRVQTLDSLSRAESALSEASIALANTERSATQEQQRSVALAQVVMAAKRLLDAERELAAHRVLIEQSSQTLEALQSRLNEVREQLAQITALRAARGTLTLAVTLARKRAQLYDTLQSVRHEISRLAPLVTDLNAARLLDNRETQRASALKAADEVERLHGELRHHDERVQAISEALSTIAHRLTHDETQCPVCATQFPPGRLLELIQMQISGGATPASEVAAALVEARARVDALAREVADTNRKIVEHEQLVATLAEHRARGEELRQQLVESGGTADGLYDETDSIRAQRELDALDQRLATSPSFDSLQTLATELETQLNAETAKRTSLERQCQSALDITAASKARLIQYPQLWNERTGLLIDPSKEHSDVEQRAATLGHRLAEDQRSVGDARSTRDSLQQSASSDAQLLDSTNSKLDELASTRKELTQKWVNEGQSGEPSTARVEQHRRRAEERRAELESVRGPYSRVVSGYKQWLNDQALRAREEQLEQIRRSEQATTDAEVTAALEKRVLEAQHSLEIAQSARSRMEVVGRLMQERAESFTGDVLAPLNSTIQRFARTLMTWSDESIIYRAEHYATRSELRPRIMRTEPDGTTMQLEMNPNLYFSEGQLSALSVSALLAASTTFNWSRWRGLLLDDPLQHNDVIHASAFMDLLRQIVRQLGYQIILSTHDSAEADFLVRKCRSAGIPYLVHELIPRGEEGLVTAVA
jgi:DNA repair exonuclease SbcCD ATPase subunit